MDIPHSLVRPKTNKKYICPIDNATMHTILGDKGYFASLVMKEAFVSAIFRSTKLIKGSKIANIVPPKGTKFVIYETLLSSKSQ